MKYRIHFRIMIDGKGRWLDTESVYTVQEAAELLKGVKTLPGFVEGDVQVHLNDEIGWVAEDEAEGIMICHRRAMSDRDNAG